MLTISSRVDVMNRLGRAMADPTRSRILLSLLTVPGYPAKLARDLDLTRTLDAEPTVILLDDPTRGIDVGAKTEIYSVMREQARAGAVQIVFSSDPLELATICDEVMVFHNGRVRARLRGDDLMAHNILEVMNTGEALDHAASAAAS